MAASFSGGLGSSNADGITVELPLHHCGRSAEMSKSSTVQRNRFTLQALFRRHLSIGSRLGICSSSSSSADITIAVISGSSSTFSKNCYPS